MLTRFLEWRRRKALVARLEAIIAGHKRPVVPIACYSFDNRPAPFSR